MTDHTPRPDSTAPLAWVLRSRALLDESLREYDGATVSRLTRARHAALDSLERDATPARGGMLRWLGGGAMTAGLALLLWRGLLPGAPDANPATATIAAAPPTPVAELSAPAVAAPDFALLVDAEDYALLEDLEFYAWLGAAEDAGG